MSDGKTLSFLKKIKGKWFRNLLGLFVSAQLKNKQCIKKIKICKPCYEVSSNGACFT
jgi:hypothetical protein